MTCKLSGYTITIDIEDTKDVSTCDPKCPRYNDCPIEKLDVSDGKAVNTFTESSVTQKDINEFLESRQLATCGFITDILVLKGKK